MKKLFLMLAALASTAASAQVLSDGGFAQAFTVTDYLTSPITNPTDMRFLPDGRLVVIEKSGNVYVRLTNGQVVGPTVFPTIDTASEKGLLGVEVHPAFATNKLLFFYYSRPNAGTTFHRVVSMILQDDSFVDLSTELVLVDGLRGPANHDGGGLTIGPDGRLYIGVGDTGCNSGTQPTVSITNWFGTCLTNGNGKVLRVELDGGIPIDNPLATVSAATACGATCGNQPSAAVTGAPRRDIYAWGFRNPWRLWTDKVTGNIWVGDVGEVSYEELIILQGGKHYGWPLREGPIGRDAGLCDSYTPGSGACAEPVYSCRHSSFAGPGDPNCSSMNGGLIVDSCTWPLPWRGSYFFGDNATRYLWALPLTAGRNAVAGVRMDVGRGAVGQGPVSFQVGPDGNLYVALFPVATGAVGKIVRIAPRNPISCDLDAGTPGSDAGIVDGGAGGGSGGGAGGGGGATGGGTGPGPGPGAGSGGGDETQTGGCGCSAGAAGAFAFIGLLFALQRRARKKR